MRNVVCAAATLALVVAAAPVSAQTLCNLKAPDVEAAGEGCGSAWMDANLHLNDVVTIGTHSSYKEAVPDKIMSLIRMGSSQGDELDFAHPPLGQQLDDGARVLELDVYYDPQGGLYVRPAGAAMTGIDVPADYAQKMEKPGFKVMDIEDVDYKSQCVTLVDCLTDIKTWSDSHPAHIPILVIINPKEDEIPMPGSVTPLKFDTNAFDALDAEVLSVISRAAIIAPDDIQGHFPTLREGVLAQGWPTLGKTRGKFLFALIETADKILAYQGGRKSLEGRAMFVAVPEGSPLAGYVALDDATTQLVQIADDVRKGFLVHTRADADTVEARANNTKRRDSAIASGAQYISTDFMHPDPRFGGYQVRLPGNAVALCNPIRQAGRCDGLAVEVSTFPQ